MVFRMIRKLNRMIDTYGVRQLPRFLRSRIVAERSRLLGGFPIEGDGVEIGGPSSVFSASGPLPIYSRPVGLDNVNYNLVTVWEGFIASAEFQPAGKPLGRQFISEAYELLFLRNESLDFLISSNMIEHSAHPIKCLLEWPRILKPRGRMIVVLPSPRYTFDNQRPVTRVSHLLDDFQADIGEDDTSHLDEIISLHNLKRDLSWSSSLEFEKATRKNNELRIAHHHVFNVKLASFSSIAGSNSRGMSFSCPTTTSTILKNDQDRCLHVHDRGAPRSSARGQARARG